MESNYIKIVMLGSSGVGKTQILNTYCFGLNPSYYPEITVGCDYVLKRVLIDGQFVKLQIWDISGAELNSPLMKIYLKGALGVLFVYDLTSESTKEALIEWRDSVLTYAEEYNGRHIPFFVVGNKMDILAQYPESSQAAGQFKQNLQKFCNVYGFEDGLIVSAFTRNGLNEAFESLVDEIIRRDLVTQQMKRTASRINKLQIDNANVDMRPKSNCYQ